MDAVRRIDSRSSLNGPPPRRGFRHAVGLAHVGRRSLGLALLMLTVFLWTASNFLASSIFADSTYSKPFFVVYVNTSVFAVSLIPVSVRFVAAHGLRGTRRALSAEARGVRQDLHAALVSLHLRCCLGHSSKGGSSTAEPRRREYTDTAERLLGPPDEEAGVVQEHEEQEQQDGDLSEASNNRKATGNDSAAVDTPPDRLSVRATAWLGLEFCLLWFSANYLAVACLEHTSVASATIFTSLSSMCTLVLCAFAGVEPFSLRKLAGVAASLAGVALVSSLDLAGQSDDARGRFPYKPPAEIALGDAMALLSALVYGIYVTVMKQRIGHEDRVDMPLFFGFVGLFNLLGLWPGFIFLHVTGIEQFQPPPSGQVWAIVLANSLASFLSDMAWAYAMLLTTPLVVTVGLSLTIPLSLVGEMIQYAQFSSPLYWAGAAMVVGSFVFVNHESRESQSMAIDSLLEGAGVMDDTP